MRFNKVFPSVGSCRNVVFFKDPIRQKVLFKACRLPPLTQKSAASSPITQLSSSQLLYIVKLAQRDFESKCTSEPWYLLLAIKGWTLTMLVTWLFSKNVEDKLCLCAVEFPKVLLISILIVSGTEMQINGVCCLSQQVGNVALQ